MRTMRGQRIAEVRMTPSGRVWGDVTLEDCVVEGGWVGTPHAKPEPRVARMDEFHRIRITNCKLLGAFDVGPCVFRDVTIDGLTVDDIVLAWAPRLEHVTLRGRIGAMNVNANPTVTPPRDVARTFAEARANFYDRVDWALDISEARFTGSFSLRGVPTHLVRRDPETQMIVTRERALGSGWRKKLSKKNVDGLFAIDSFLEDDEPARVLVARRGSRKFRQDLDALSELRDLGVLE